MSISPTQDKLDLNLPHRPQGLVRYVNAALLPGTTGLLPAMPKDRYAGVPAPLCLCAGVSLSQFRSAVIKANLSFIRPPPMHKFNSPSYQPIALKLDVSGRPPIKGQHSCSPVPCEHLFISMSIWSLGQDWNALTAAIGIVLVSVELKSAGFSSLGSTYGMT